MCSYARDFTKLSVEETTKCAVARAVRVANAHPIRTVEVPIILDPWVAARFVELLAHSVSAEFVRKGRSSLKGRLGELIASPVVSVMDDGGLISSPFAMPFDAEGVSTRKTCVIRDGRVESFLYDTYEACAAKKRSTGNASRASFRDSPVPGKSNLYIIPGSQSSDDIVLSTQRGLYVQELQGIHTANPVSGDFSVGVTGGWIESGEWVHAVRGVTIAGNLFELLQRIDAVGDDLQFFTFPRVLVTCAGSPTLRVASLVVSGN